MEGRIHRVPSDIIEGPEVVAEIRRVFAPDEIRRRLEFMVLELEAAYGRLLPAGLRRECAEFLLVRGEDLRDPGGSVPAVRGAGTAGIGRTGGNAGAGHMVRT